MPMRGKFGRVCEQIGVILVGMVMAVPVSAAKRRVHRSESGEGEASTDHDEAGQRARTAKCGEDSASSTSPCASEVAAAAHRSPKSLELRQSRELQIAGGVFAGAGLVGLVVGVAGVALGARKQEAADAKLLPEQQADVDQLDKEGARANQMGLVGFVVGGGLVVVGLGLVAAGVVRGKRDQQRRDAHIRLMPMGGRHGSGLMLQGRF